VKRHPLSAAFPDIPSDDFDALVEDIKKNGLRDHGWVYDNQIIDGWHRFKACEIAGRKFRYETYKGSDPVAFVLSRNAYRRHLSASQRAQAVVACHNWLSRGKHKEKDNPHPVRITEISTAEMAKEARVSERTIEQAKVAHAAGLGDAVKDGALSVKEAAAIATGKPAKQKHEKKSAAKNSGAEKVANATSDTRVKDLERENAALKKELEALKEKLELVYEGAEEAVAKAEAADALLNTEPAKVLLKYKQEIRRLEGLRDDLQNQNGQLVRQLRAVQSKLDKLTRLPKATVERRPAV
jgi:hypothetical protein